mgnify:CR=1 FL=1
MMKDTSIRYIEMLQFLPVFPAKRSLSQIREHLKALDYSVTDRTIQRDLRKLEDSGFFGIRHEESIPYGWYFIQGAKKIELASMSHAEALTLNLAKTYLFNVLPINHSTRMTSLFDRAESFLDQMQGYELIKWKDKVRVIPVTHGYVAPKIKDEIQGVIYESLLREKQFAGKYLSREATKSKKAIFNPLAIVSHGVVTRVICTREIGGQIDNIIRYLPIHRFKSVRPLEDKINIPKGFNLDDYLSTGQIEYLYDESIELHLKFTHSAGLHLTETPFSKDQDIKIVKGKSITLKANTPYTETLKRWILGFGDQVKVMGPTKLKKEIQEIYKKSLRN